MSPLIAVAVAVAALSVWLTLRLTLASRGRSLARAAYFNAVKPLFDTCKVRIQPTGFARMTGQRDGLSFDLQAISDTLTYRKLPALWVMVTLPGSQPIQATLDLMARPSGQESFSRFADLPQWLPILPGLPKHVAVRSDDVSRIPPAELLTRYADLFDDVWVKELVISPKGLRIVILAEEADRGRYLIFRDTEMGMSPLNPARLAPLLERLGTLRKDLLALAEHPA